MPISWNEIKTRAVTFSKEWESTQREEADAKEFLIEFLNVFGITKKRVATLEHKVKKLNTADGYIEFLFELYDKYTAGLFTQEKKGRKKVK